MTAHHSILRRNTAEPKMRWMLLISFIIHLAVVITFVGKPPDSSKKVYFSPVYSVSLVGMPPPSGTAKGHGPSGKNKVSLWKGPAGIDSRVKSLGKRKHTLLTISKKDKLLGRDQEEGNAQSGRPGASADGKAAPGAEGSPAGVQGTEGGRPYGTAGGIPGATPANLRFNLYYQAIWNKIKAAWVLPSYGSSRKQLEAIVILKIKKDGKILNIAFEKKSGDSSLDRSVIRAIKKADPLPPLPPGFKQNYLELGIRFMPEG
jgi:TonB family protein